MTSPGRPTLWFLLFAEVFDSASSQGLTSAGISSYLCVSSAAEVSFHKVWQAGCVLEDAGHSRTCKGLKKKEIHDPVVGRLVLRR